MAGDTSSENFTHGFRMVGAQEAAPVSRTCATAIMELEDLAVRTRVERRTVNLTAYPDLVVIYLGMRVNRIARISPPQSDEGRVADDPISQFPAD